MTRGDWLWLCIWRCVLVKHLVFLTLSFYLSRSAVIFLLTWQTLKFFSWTTELQNSAQSIKCLIYCLKIIPSQLYEQLFCFLLTVLVYFGAAMRWKVEVTTTHTLDFYALWTLYIRTVKSLLLFRISTNNSLWMVWKEIECMVPFFSTQTGSL